MFDAKRANDDVRGLADRDSKVRQLAIIPGSSRGEISVEKGHNLEPAQTTLDARGMNLVPSALKNFKQNEIADKYRFAAGRSFQLGGPWR
jgi:hypothetical protein